jgi:hypothetical protein
MMGLQGPPWDWHELPIDDGDPKRERITSGDTLIVEQHAGRTDEIAPNSGSTLTEKGQIPAPGKFVRTGR